MAAGPVVIGVAGGSGSGKTTVVRRIVESLGSDLVTVLEHDRYYRYPSDLRLEERAALNYDHPDSLETDLLVQHVEQLRAGQTVEVPLYDFTRYARLDATDHAQPRRAIIVEGTVHLARFDVEMHEHDVVVVHNCIDLDARVVRAGESDWLVALRALASPWPDGFAAYQSRYLLRPGSDEIHVGEDAHKASSRDVEFLPAYGTSVHEEFTEGPAVGALIGIVGAYLSALHERDDALVPGSLRLRVRSLGVALLPAVFHSCPHADSGPN